jgi:hypothetical protein
VPVTVASNVVLVPKGMVASVPAVTEGSVLTVTASVLAVLAPQLLVAVTDNVPEVADTE